jgi:hypothetical protein
MAISSIKSTDGSLVGNGGGSRVTVVKPLESITFPDEMVGNQYFLSGPDERGLYKLTVIEPKP